MAVDEVLLVQAGEPPREHYDLLHFEVAVEGESISVNLIPIARASDNKLLVALPKSVWSQRTAGRLLPKGGLQKAELVEVSAALSTSPEEELEEEPIELWVGLLEKKLEKKLVLGGAENPTADVRVFLDEELCHIPFGPSLAALCEDRFAFASAQSQAEVVQNVETRMNKLEEMLLKVQTSLDQVILKQSPQPSILKSRAKAKPEPAPQEAVPGVEDAAGTAALGSMDPTVVTSALQAGIPKAQLEKLAGLLKKSSRMQDVGGKAAKKKVSGVLDETDEEQSEAEEDQVEEEGFPEEGGAAMQKAVLKLTKIAEELSSSKKKGKELDVLLDLAESTGESSSSTGWSKSKAAAFKKLRDALEKQPQLISKSIEDAMALDFSQIKKGPGSAAVEVSSRGWLEHRSKLQYYPNTIRQGWILAGIHDAMRENRWEEAKARTLLALAALDQSSLDSGNWALAQEVLLEAAPPFPSFIGKKMPESWEQPVSKLVDDRWAEVLMWRLRDRDNFVEARKRLSNNRPKGGADPNALQPGNPTWDPKPKPKAKVRPAKGGAKGGQEAEASQ